jgi:hypothetical protein
MSKRKFGRYKSDINIKDYAGKIYIDQQYGTPVPDIKINYVIFSSKWDIEEIPEDNILKIIHRLSGDSISISFRNLSDRIAFVKNIYTSKPVKQIGKGMNLEQFANLNLKPVGDELSFEKRLKNFLIKRKSNTSNRFAFYQNKIAYIASKVQSLLF